MQQWDKPIRPPAFGLVTKAQTKPVSPEKGKSTAISILPIDDPHVPPEVRKLVIIWGALAGVERWHNLTLVRSNLDKAAAKLLAAHSELLAADAFNARTSETQGYVASSVYVHLCFVEPVKGKKVYGIRVHPSDFQRLAYLAVF